jgi:hypothetical protein
MLYTTKLLAALEGQRGRFQGYEQGLGQDLRAYRAALARLTRDFPAAAELAAALSADEPPAGACPTREYDYPPVGADSARNRSTGDLTPGRSPALPRLPFAPRFAHHQDARAWAECIWGTTTLAVDGSQLLPWRDASIPIAYVQVGVFENPHLPGTPYRKDAIVEVLPPDELLGAPSLGRPQAPSRYDLAEGPGALRAPGAEGNRPCPGPSGPGLPPGGPGSPPDGPGSRPPADAPQDEPLAPQPFMAGIAMDEDSTLDTTGYAYANQLVHLRRLELEVRTIIDACDRYAAHPGDGPTPVIFYDGSLVVSFALTMPPAYRTRYVAAARALLLASERTRIPIVAYIDTSHARDVTTMLRRLYGTLSPARQIHDALLWHGQLAWGDRTPAFICARGDILRSYGEQHADIAFVYLQTTGDRPPARLEFPRWLIDAGQLDRVLDVVRAEVIAGNGYPYAIEAADAVAVISLADRAEFYRIFQDFARHQGVDLAFSRKAVSKSRRRI